MTARASDLSLGPAPGGSPVTPNPASLSRHSA
jgi:hypothetical protein